MIKYTDEHAAIALAAAEAFSPANPATRRARAYAAWYLRTFLPGGAIPATVPDHTCAMALFAHETDGAPA